LNRNIQVKPEQKNIPFFIPEPTKPITIPSKQTHNTLKNRN
jgi:hypothetical protein